MSIEIKTPVFPESIQDGTVATWYKQVGEAVARDEQLVDIETDKVVIEVVAPAAGVLESVLKPEGETVLSGELLGILQEGAVADSKHGAGRSERDKTVEQKKAETVTKTTTKTSAGPAARKAAREAGVDLGKVNGSGDKGRITKADVQAATLTTPAIPESGDIGARPEKRVPMTRLRKRIAERLVEASQTTAMLTTFNEANMAAVIRLRKKFGEQFENSHHGVRLGFMSFFVKACVEALRRFPAVNASLDGGDIVYHGYQDIGVAVSTDKGLVVPVLRNAEDLSLASIEQQVRDYGLKAREGKLAIEEITGGTFTITNGGVFGSLLSTPILNPPQTAILGMHKIQERPVVVDGKIIIAPMMYLALSYDHRLIDGKEAVQFLVAVKDIIEDPGFLALDI
jgi:2-oxoglutarate dehydrogenase E2 component (dihydrolipoamide succinyltransferase)